MSARPPETDSLRAIIARYDLRHADVARHAGVNLWSLATALDRDQLRGLRPDTRKRYLAAIEKARRDVLRKVAVAVS